MFENGYFFLMVWGSREANSGSIEAPSGGEMARYKNVGEYTCWRISERKKKYFCYSLGLMV